MQGKELTRMLKAAGMSRRALGRELNIADTTVGRWANGDHPIGYLEALGLVLYFRQVKGIESKWQPLKVAA